MTLWINWIFLAMLSFSQESIVTKLGKTTNIDCDYVIHKLDQQGEDYARLADLMLLEKQKFNKWQDSNWIQSYRYNQYVKVLEEIGEVSLLLYFADLPNLSTRGIELNAKWPVEGNFSPKDFEYFLPGYLPLGLNTLNTLRDVSFHLDADLLSVNILVSPVDYCLNPRILLHSKDKTYLAN